MKHTIERIWVIDFRCWRCKRNPSCHTLFQRPSNILNVLHITLDGCWNNVVCQLGFGHLKQNGVTIKWIWFIQLTLTLSIFFCSLLASEGTCSWISRARWRSASASHGKKDWTLCRYSWCLVIDSLISVSLKDNVRISFLYLSLISCNFCSSTQVWLLALAWLDKGSGILAKYVSNSFWNAYGKIGKEGMMDEDLSGLKG